MPTLVTIKYGYSPVFKHLTYLRGGSSAGFTFEARSRGGAVMKETVGERSADLFVGEHEQ